MYDCENNTQTVHVFCVHVVIVQVYCVIASLPLLLGQVPVTGAEKHIATKHQ